MKIFSDGCYFIKKTRRGYIVINSEGEYSNHSHFKNFGAAKQCIYLTKNKILPKSFYMMVACMRLSTDELYIWKIEKLKEVKENRQKNKYTNKKLSYRRAAVL